MKEEKFKIIQFIREFIIMLEKELENFPKKDIEIKNHLREDTYELLEFSYLANKLNYVEGEDITIKYLSKEQNIEYNFVIKVTGEIETISKEIVNINEAEKDYLIDVAEIGDYVNIGVDYENKGSFDLSNLQNSSELGLTAWRVLSKTVIGEDGVIKLISAGTPITFEKNSYLVAGDIGRITYLERELTESLGFVEVGFENRDLGTIFSSIDCVDISKGIYSVSTEEIIEAYSQITDITISRDELLSSNICKTSSMLDVKSDLSSKAYDLLCCGSPYCLRESSDDYSETNLDIMKADGQVESVDSGTYGVRPVITLKQGLKVTNGTGSRENAYDIIIEE